MDNSNSYNYKNMSDKDIRQKVLNKQNMKLTYGQRLKGNVKNTGKRAELAKAGGAEALAKQRGRKSYAEKAVLQGVYDDITYTLEEFALQNPFWDESDLYNYMTVKFSSVFAGCSKYPQNFFKLIDKEDAWHNALAKKSLYEVQKQVLKGLHTRAVKGVRELIDKDGKHYEIGMSDSNRMNYIRLLIELEMNKEMNENNSSSETAETFNKIMDGLNEIGGDKK